MKILCLAGFGSSGRVFEKQTAQLRKLLPESIEYVFTEGEIECARHPSIPKAMPGPFYCWYRSVEPGPLRMAHELLHEIIEEEGPFDGVIAFSQGAALTVSMLMDQEIYRPGERPLFSFAALFSCPIALSPDTRLNRETLREATVKKRAGDKDTDDATSAAIKSAPRHRLSLLLSENKLALAREYVGVLDDAKETAKDIGIEDFTSSSSSSTPSESSSASAAGSAAGSADNSESDADDDADDEELKHVPRLLHPLMVSARVSVPTLHLYDTTDKYYRQFKFVMRLCDRYLTSELQHSGGHGIPTDPKEIRQCAAAINKLMEKGRQRISMF